MICRDCALWFELNQKTEMGTCLHPQHGDRGDFSFYRCHAETHCSIGILATLEQRIVNRSQCVQASILTVGIPLQHARG
jgi:hypothetical protein